MNNSTNNTSLPADVRKLLARESDVPRHLVIQAVRLLMPNRPLQTHEARSIAERQAHKLTELLDLVGPMIDVEPIAGLPRIHLRCEVALPVSGFSEWNQGRWTVGINADDHPARRRFTLCHEVKHILDNPFITQIYPGPDGTPSQQRAEEICDYFAACLLMPRNAVKQMWSQGHQRPGDLAAHFGVSRASMVVRLYQLGLTSDRKPCRPLPSVRYERASTSSVMATAAQGSGVWE